MSTTPADPKQHPTGNAIKDAETWVTGDEPMTGAQASYLETLARQAGEDPITGDLTKAQASEPIDELRGKAGLTARDEPAGDR